MKGLDKLKAQLATHMDLLDQRTLRERVMLLGTLLVVIVCGWNLVFFEPLLGQRKVAVEQIRKAKLDSIELQAQIEVLAARKSQDPNEENRQRLASLKVDLERLDKRLQGVMLDMVSPQQMPEVLEDIFGLHTDLKLVKIENLGAEPWPPQNEKEKGAGQAGRRLFRHALRIEFEGNYVDAMEYFQALEGLPQRLFWETLDIRVGEYPLSTITVKVSTLSLKEGWIGV